MAELMDAIKRNSIRSASTAPLLSSFEWAFEFNTLPGYSEGTSLEQMNKLFLGRATSVTVPADPSDAPMSVVIHGHVFSQVGLTPHNGSFSISFQDFADLKIQKYFSKLRYSATDPITKATNGSPNNYFFNCTIYRLDPTRKIVKVWKCVDCLCITCDADDSMTSDKSPIGGCTVGFTCDLFTTEFLDTPASNLNNDSYYNFSGGQLGEGISVAVKSNQAN